MGFKTMVEMGVIVYQMFYVWFLLFSFLWVYPAPGRSKNLLNPVIVSGHFTGQPLPVNHGRPYLCQCANMTYMLYFVFFAV
jgi:hypothetical protein